MINNIKFKFEFLKTQDNIMIENKLENILKNKIILSDLKERFNQFVLWKI